MAAGGAGNFNVTAGTAPTFVSSGNTMNGRPVVHFNNSAMLSNATNFGNNVTVMYVGRMTGGKNQRLVGGGNNWLLGYWGGNMNVHHWSNSPSLLSGALDYNAHIFVGTANGTNAWLYNADQNELQVHTGALGAGPSGLFLGGYGAGEQSYGDIGELLVFNRALTTAERLQVAKYLQAKWYGALPSKSAVNLTASGATFDLNGFKQTIGSLAGVVDSQVLVNGGDLTIGNANNAAPTNFSGVIADGTTAGGTLTKTGNGDLVLDGSASNTFTGTTTLMSGRIGLAKTGGAYPFTGPLVLLNEASPDLYATVDNQFQPGTVMRFTGAIGDHARFELLGTTQMLAGIDNTGAAGHGVIQHREQVPTAAVDATSELVLNGTGTYTFDGYLRHSSGTLALTKDGSGTQILGGNTAYNGTTTLNAGVLTYTVANQVMGGALVLNGGLLNHTGGGYLVFSGAVNVAVNSTINITSNLLYFDAGVTGAGNLTINTTGGAASGLVFRNASGTYTGATSVTGGKIVLSASTGLVFQNSPVTLSGATVDMTATAASLKSLTGNGAEFSESRRADAHAWALAMAAARSTAASAGPAASSKPGPAVRW